MGKKSTVAFSLERVARPPVPSWPWHWTGILGGGLCGMWNEHVGELYIHTYTYWLLVMLPLCEDWEFYPYIGHETLSGSLVVHMYFLLPQHNKNEKCTNFWCFLKDIPTGFYNVLKYTNKIPYKMPYFTWPSATAKNNDSVLNELILQFPHDGSFLVDFPAWWPMDLSRHAGREEMDGYQRATRDYITWSQHNMVKCSPKYS